MRSVISRPVRLFALIVTAGVVLAGCGSGPSQVGAAAIVGGTRIPLSDVQTSFDAVLTKEPDVKSRLQQKGQMDDLARSLASLRVQEELVQQAARREQLSVSEQEVTDRINQQGGSAAADGTRENLRAAARTELLATKLGRRYLDRTSVTFDFTQANTRREAERKVRQLAQGPAQAAALFDAERKAGTPVSLGKHIRAADSSQLAAATPLFGARPGTALAFEMRPQSSQWLVVRITGRSTDEARSEPVADSTNEQTLRSFGMRLLGTSADNASVRLNPRYGVWDPVALAAAPNENETLGFWFSGPDDLT